MTSEMEVAAPGTGTATKEQTPTKASITTVSVAPTAPPALLPEAPGLPAADIPERRPTLDGRALRTGVLWEVRTKTQVDGETETWIYRRENAARAHARRLRTQGYPVKLVGAAVTGWSVIA